MSVNIARLWLPWPQLQLSSTKNRYFLADLKEPPDILRHSCEIPALKSRTEQTVRSNVHHAEAEVL